MATKTNSEAVKEFTEGYMNIKCPDHPIVMDKEAVKFVVRMVISELDELVCTVTNNEDESRKFMLECVTSIDKCNNYEYVTDLDKVSAQADSMVDAWYYMLNYAAKHGMNLSRLFDVVHEANMAKRDPKTGKFIRRELDGKVIKPEGWQPPDVEGEMKKQMENGSW